jgi:hypothetical protein
MSDLAHLSFDVFLSYGWAGIPDKADADRGWVAEFKRVFEGELSGELGRHARVHLDVEQSNNGELPANLRERVARSAMFLSVITKGSCRKGSWCHEELKWFLGDAPAVLPSRRQVFSLLLRDVEQDAWPESLRPIVPTSFLIDEGGTKRPFAESELGDSATDAGARLQTLAVQVARTLESIEKEIARTVVLAGAGEGVDSLMARLDIEITKRTGAVNRMGPEAGEDEATYVDRLSRALNGASLLVYLAGEGQPPTPAGWSRSIERVYMEAAVARFGPDSRQNIVWRAGSSSEAADWPSAQVLKDLGFEYLHTLLCQTLDTNVTAAAARVASRKEKMDPPPPLPSASQRFVFVECVQSDLERLLPLQLDGRRHSVFVKFPLFQGDATRRRAADAEFLPRCEAAAVFFGSREDLDAYLACQELADTLSEHAVTIPCMVVLDPESDPLRQGFGFPGFQNVAYKDFLALIGAGV